VLVQQYERAAYGDYSFFKTGGHYGGEGDHSGVTIKDAFKDLCDFYMADPGERKTTTTGESDGDSDESGESSSSSDEEAGDE
jgi:hypothetical protein